MSTTKIRISQRLVSSKAFLRKEDGTLKINTSDNRNTLGLYCFGNTETVEYKLSSDSRASFNPNDDGIVFTDSTLNRNYIKPAVEVDINSETWNNKYNYMGDKLHYFYEVNGKKKYLIERGCSIQNKLLYSQEGPVWTGSGTSTGDTKRNVVVIQKLYNNDSYRAVIRTLLMKDDDSYGYENSTESKDPVYIPKNVRMLRILLIGAGGSGFPSRTKANFVGYEQWLGSGGGSGALADVVVDLDALWAYDPSLQGFPYDDVQVVISLGKPWRNTNDPTATQFVPGGPSYLYTYHHCIVACGGKPGYKTYQGGGEPKYKDHDTGGIYHAPAFLRLKEVDYPGSLDEGDNDLSYAYNDLWVINDYDNNINKYKLKSPGNMPSKDRPIASYNLRTSTLFDGTRDPNTMYSDPMHSQGRDDFAGGGAPSIFADGGNAGGNGSEGKTGRKGSGGGAGDSSYSLWSDNYTFGGPGGPGYVEIYY